MLKLQSILSIIHGAHIRIIGYKTPLESPDSEDLYPEPKEYVIYEGLKGGLPLRIYEVFQKCTILGIYPMHEKSKEEKDSSTHDIDLLEIQIDLDKVPDDVILW